MRDISPAQRRVVVTGASGFIGRRVVPTLQAAGYDVGIVVRRGQWVDPSWRPVVFEDDGDAGALEGAMKAWAPDVCMHLATRFSNQATAEDVMAMAESNIAFGMRVANAFAASGGRAFIYTSSFSQRRGGGGYSPTNLYAATKQAFADILRHYAEAGDFRVLDLQLFDTFGPGDVRPKIWTALMKAVWTGEPLATSQGEQLMSPSHVEDVARALVTAVRASLQQQVQWVDHHLLGPEVLTLRQVVERFASAIGNDVPVSWGARPYSGNEMFQLWLSGLVLPDYSPRVSLEEGFRQVWEEFVVAQFHTQSTPVADVLPASRLPLPRSRVISGQVIPASPTGWDGVPAERPSIGR